MPQPVKLSDSLVLDARIASDAVQRSIASQVEFWARLGRSIEPLLKGEHVFHLCRTGTAQPLSSCLDSVNSAAGRSRLTDYLNRQPFPHYQPHPTRPGLLERVDQDGARTVGRFVNREFKTVKPARRNFSPVTSVRKPRMTKSSAR